MHRLILALGLPYHRLREPARSHIGMHFNCGSEPAPGGDPMKIFSGYGNSRQA